MMQEAAEALYEAIRRFGAWLQSVGWLMLIGWALALAVAVFLYWRSPETLQKLAAWLRPRAASALSWVVALGMTCLVAYILVQEGRMVAYREEAEESATLTATEEAPSNPVDQFGPVAAYLRERTFTKELRLPSELAGKMGTPSVQSFAPYLQQGFTNAIKVKESFTRKGPDIVYLRESTLQEEVPILMDRADARAVFKTKRDAKGKPYYHLSFEGQYAFHNPLGEEALGRFVFTPPSSATVENLSVKVGGVLVDEPNETGNYVWQGLLARGAEVTATVRYATAGGETWSYSIGSGRRRTGDFRLTVESDSPPKFVRGSLFPTGSEGGRHTWRLQNVITSQTIDLAFPQDQSEREGRENALAFLPVALGFFFAWLTLRILVGRPVEGGKSLFAVLSLGLGFASIAVFLGYLPILWAIVAGAALACALTFVSCGARLIPGVALAAVSPLAMLIPEHSSLALLALSVLSLLSLSPGRRRGPSESAA